MRTLKPGHCLITTFSENKRFSFFFSATDQLNSRFNYVTVKNFELTWHLRKQHSNLWMLLVCSQNPNHKQTKKQQKKYSLEKIVIRHSSTKCPGLSVLTVIPPVLSYRNLFLVALLKSKGSWLTRFGYWVPNSAFRNSQRIAFRVNMKSYPGKV